MSTRSVPGINRPGRGVATHRCLASELKKERELYPYSSSVPSWQVVGWTLPSEVMHQFLSEIFPVIFIYLFLNITLYSFFNIIIEANKNNRDNLRKMHILVSVFRGTHVEQHCSKYSWPCSWPDGVPCCKTSVICYFVTVCHCCCCYYILRFI